MKKIITIALIILATFAVYSHTFNCEWHFDDTVNITRNPNIHMEDISWRSIKAAMFAGGIRGDIYHPILYRPVTMLSFAFNYYFHEKELPGYHVVNIAIHLITTIFLFLFIHMFMGLKYSPDKALGIAAIATVLWALNPLQITSITYIVQRMSSLAGMFFAMTMYFYLKARTRGSVRYAVISALCAVLAVLSKENAIMVVFAVFMFECMFFMKKETVKRSTAFMLWTVLAGIFIIYAVQGTEIFSLEVLQSGFAKRNFTLWERLITEPRVLLFYLMLLFIPHHSLLSLTHNVTISHGILDPPQTLVAIIIIISLIGVGIAYRKKYPIAAFSIFFYFLCHIVESSFLPLELVYEHRNYIPSFLLFVPLAILVVEIKRVHVKRFVTAGVAAMAVFFAYNTYEQNKVWETDLSLWYDVCSKSPDPRSAFNYAGSQYSKRNYKEAAKYWEITFRFNELFGTNYSLDPNSIPYGRVAYMGYRNHKKMNMLVKEGWADYEMADAWTIRTEPVGADEKS